MGSDPARNSNEPDLPEGGTAPDAAAPPSESGFDRPSPALLKSAFGGDRTAFQAVVEKLWGLIFVFIRQRIRDRGRAEDLTQDTFLQGWEKRESLRDPESAISWLLAIASRKVIDSHRWYGARPESRMPEHHDPSGGSDEAPFPEERAAEVQEALAEVPELYRTVLILRYWSGLTPSQIARLLGEPEGTIRNRIFRAHLQLRKVLATAEGAEDEIEK